jgi:hypothetical protein
MKRFSTLTVTGGEKEKAYKVLVLRQPKICLVTRQKKSQDSIKMASDGILILDADVGEGWNQFKKVSSDRLWSYPC